MAVSKDLGFSSLSESSAHPDRRDGNSSYEIGYCIIPPRTYYLWEEFLEGQMKSSVTLDEAQNGTNRRRLVAKLDYWIERKVKPSSLLVDGVKAHATQKH